MQDCDVRAACCLACCGDPPRPPCLPPMRRSAPAWALLGADRARSPLGRAPVPAGPCRSGPTCARRRLRRAQRCGRRQLPPPPAAGRPAAIAPLSAPPRRRGPPASGPAARSRRCQRWRARGAYLVGERGWRWPRLSAGQGATWDEVNVVLIAPIGDQGSREARQSAVSWPRHTLLHGTLLCCQTLILHSLQALHVVGTTATRLVLLLSSVDVLLSAAAPRTLASAASACASSK